VRSRVKWQKTERSLIPVPKPSHMSNIMAASRYTDFNLYARLLRQAQPYWPHIGALLLLNFLSTPVALLTPLPLKIAVDNVVGSHPIPGFLGAILPQVAARSPTAVLVFAAGLFVAIALLDRLRYLGSSLLGTYTGEKLLLDFRTRLFGHAQRLSLSYHDSTGTADSMYRIQHDAGSIYWISIYGVTPFVGAGLTLIGMVSVTAQIDWQLALIALVVLPLMFLITSDSSRRLRNGWETAKNLESSTLSVVQEVLMALRVVKAFGQEEREQARFVSRSGEGMRARIRLAFIDGGFGLLFGLTIAVGSALVLFIGVGHVQIGLLTLGDLVLVMGYLAQLYVPMHVISNTITTMQSALASAERAFALLEKAPDVVEKPDARALTRATGAIAWHSVCFGYDDGQFVLRNLSFEIPPGSRLGIVGATGAGKTTMVSLLIRFYDPTHGRILLDGVDLRDYKLADLRNQFGIMLQEPVLLSTTIAENISYARPGSSKREIIEAAKAANAHEFIMGLPQGYETLVGERGMRLSGGERQRISLARAFLKDAPILILDEPTSSVDIDTEAAIMEAMERLMRGRTTFIIAHRLTTLSNCDLRLEIDAGRISNGRSSASPTSFDAA
jgi:ATP-binding cassette, subfamily B, bacterial